MADWGKAIKGLECCTQHGSMCGQNCNGHWDWTDDSHTGMKLLGEYRTKCPYGNCEMGCVKTLAHDALELLKAQESVEPTLDIRHGKLMWRCGSCLTALQPNQMHAKYCFNCGRRVQWE